MSFNFYEKLEKQEYYNASKANNRIIGYVTNTDGEKTPLFKGAINGWLEKVPIQDNQIEFKGWVFDGRNSRVPEFVLASYVGKIIYQGRNNTFRPDVAKTHRNTASKSGFTFVLLSI